MASLFKGLERIEEARERLTGHSFMAGVFVGKPDFSLLVLPEESPEHTAAWERFRPQLETFLRTHVDPDEIERTAKIPDSVFKGLFALGAFGMKIPKEYGGLGFSYTNYGRALMLIASWSNILALTVAVPQSIGIAMPVLLFGSEEQKRKFLPIVAREAVSAFALTESATGSDAANIRTDAVLDAGGAAFVVNGEKLWCTNGSIARYVTLVARVPAKKVLQGGRTSWVPVPEGKDADDHVHTIFILDMESPGVRVEQRCQFEGCRGIENAYMTFTDVRVPAANVIGEVGRGLKYALSILNVGRAISIPAICLGMAKQAWQPTLDRTSQRITFQRPLSERQTQRMRLGRMAVDLFAMEALAYSVWRMADQHSYDVRIEAAITKIFCSEHTIQFLKDAQIIFGGMGYETADSKRFRGEPAFGIEQLVRDAEMYRIGEGATDVMRPFVAREGLSPHLERAQRYLKGPSKWERLVELFKLVRFYAPWYIGLWRRRRLPERAEFRHPKVAQLLGYVEYTSRRLASAIFWAMVRHGEQLRDDQGRQTRMEMIGEHLLTIATVALEAASPAYAKSGEQVWELVDHVVAVAKVQVDRAIAELRGRNQDHMIASIGRQGVEGTYGWLSQGIIPRGLHDYLQPSSERRRDLSK